MRSTLWFALLAVLLTGVGCNSGSTADVTAKKGEATTPPAPTAEAPVTPKLEELPANLRHSGFEFYGLGVTQPVDMEVRLSNGTVLTGSQITTLKSISDGKAVFSIDRTGALASLGSMELSLEPEGIYVKSSTIAKVGDRDLEFPSSVEPGKKWSSTAEIDMDNRSLKVTSNQEVVGTREVTTKKGKFENALLVTSKGTGVINGKNATMEMRSWHVKGMGAIKMEMKTTFADGKSETTVIEQTK
jgi:hypothetical protein